MAITNASRLAWARNDRRRLMAALKEAAFVAENCTRCPDCSEAVQGIVAKALRDQAAFLKARRDDDAP